jgi:hypothetical protein
MNQPSTPSSTPENTVSPGEAAASAYLAEELSRARKTLVRTRLICVLLLVCIGAYVGVISTIMVNFFQPRTAAQVASGMLAQHAVTAGPVLAAQIEREIPLFVRGVPDYLIKEMPGCRKNVQVLLEAEYQAYCKSLSKKLGDATDKLIDDHRDQIKTLLENASDRAAIRNTLPDLSRVLDEFTRNDEDGRKLKKHIDELAATLKEVERRMDRLANASDLTPEEKKARRALAMLSKVIEDKTRMPQPAATVAKTTGK